MRPLSDTEWAHIALWYWLGRLMKGAISGPVIPYIPPQIRKD